jgi:Protein of unknown function (DUF2889)
MDRQIHTTCHYGEDGRQVYEGELRDRWFSADETEVNDLHWWTLRLDVDAESGEVVAATATPKRLPFPECPAVALQVNRLVGLNLRKGFRAGMKEALGTLEGCTHLHTLATNIWSTQIIARYLDNREEVEDHVPPSDAKADLMVDVCRGWGADSAVIRAARKRTPRPGPWVEGMPTSE